MKTKEELDQECSEKEAERSSISQKMGEASKNIKLAEEQVTKAKQEFEKLLPSLYSKSDEVNALKEQLEALKPKKENKQQQGGKKHASQDSG